MNEFEIDPLTEDDEDPTELGLDSLESIIEEEELGLPGTSEEDPEDPLGAMIGIGLKAAEQETEASQDEETAYGKAGGLEGLEEDTNDLEEVVL